METIRITMFGKLRVQQGDTELCGFEARKVQELLCYLLLHRNQVHHRERLATLFWENQTTANSRKYLRQTLWQLQAALEKPSGPGEPVLLADDEWIQVNPAAPLWVDVTALEEAFAAVQQVPGGQLSTAQTTLLEDAAGRYQADLLEGWFMDWCIFERERLQSMYLGVLDKLVSGCEARQEYARGIAYAAAILRCDRARERTHRHVMRMHYLAGDRTRALREYDTCVAALRDELGVEPARSTVELYEVIRNDRLLVLPPANTGATTGVNTGVNTLLRAAGAAAAAGTVGAIGSGSAEHGGVDHGGAASLGDLLRTLAHVQEGINSLNAQLDSCMKAIERVLWS